MNSEYLLAELLTACAQVGKLCAIKRKGANAIVRAKQEKNGKRTNEEGAMKKIIQV